MIPDLPRGQQVTLEGLSEIVDRHDALSRCDELLLQEYGQGELSRPAIIALPDPGLLSSLLRPVRLGVRVCLRLLLHADISVTEQTVNNDKEP